MTWPKYVLLTWMGVEALSAVALIGRQRKPIDPGTAVASLLLYAAMALLVVSA